MWLLLVLFLVGVLIYYLSRTLYNFYTNWKAVKGVPGYPPIHWFWGNIQQVYQMYLHEKEALKFIKYVGDNNIKLLVTWYGPFHPKLGVYHCSLVGKILKQPKYQETYSLLKPWLGDGLLISKGDKWLRNRRLLTPAFHFEILSPYISVYNNCTSVLIEKWVTSAKLNDSVDLFDSISLLSLDIILRCSFSFNSDCQDMKHAHPYIQAIQDISELTVQRFVSLLYRFDWIYYLTSTGRKYKKLCKFVHDHSRMVIQKRRSELQLDKDTISDSSEPDIKSGKYLDFLDVLLMARDDKGNGLTDQEIQDEVDTFMFGGHDTTTSGMCWTLYCLAKYPEHQETVREEVRNVLMGREWLEYDNLKNLKYTHWCIKEAMRLYPPAFFITREASEDIELDGHRVPKGMEVTINIRSILRHSDTWENPDEFDPLRFHPNNCEGRHPFAYIPFSGGQRNCIGQNFALNEERVVIASIVNRFKLSLVDGHVVESSPEIVLRSKNDIKVNLELLSV